MNDLAAEFREVCSLYTRFSEELAEVIHVDDAKDPQILVKSILQNRACLERITQMNSRVAKLSDYWEKYGIQLDPGSRKEVLELAAAAKKQATRLQELCSLQIQKVQRLRDAIGKDLTKLGIGNQFLKSINPVKNNFPKFIDSLY